MPWKPVRKFPRLLTRNISSTEIKAYNGEKNFQACFPKTIKAHGTQEYFVGVDFKFLGYDELSNYLKHQTEDVISETNLEKLGEKFTHMLNFQVHSNCNLF